GPALVLGSTQTDGVADRSAARQMGVAVVRRRSGGGAVLLVPSEHVWVDVLLPAGDPLWNDDVGASFGWLGVAWVRALASLGVDGAVVGGGPRCRTRLGRAVCFGGLVPGEVVAGEAKLVGLAQRRTRAGARFQCLIHRQWRASWYRQLLAPVLSDPADAAALDRIEVGTVGAGPDEVVEALVAALPR
ncbi:lipoyl protein ligase domain-containing protein, partial [Rhabdothermincola sp.]|uniref:lipoyl protein ligase domain-containing protein n=1 Tax=Rhabdothermincola sp. TaxID=2820405 RepID=UPI002FE2E951